MKKKEKPTDKQWNEKKEPVQRYYFSKQEMNNQPH